MTTTATEGPIPLLRLFQLLSPSLPVGAFAYSQGLEWAVESGWVGDQLTLADWLSDQLAQALTFVDLPILLRMAAAAIADDAQTMAHWISELRALRETAELRAEEAGRGRALADLLGSFGLLDEPRTGWHALLSQSHLAGFAFAAAKWNLGSYHALLGYGWSWAENLTLAGVKLIPLGQTAGQRILLSLAEQIPAAVERAQALDDNAIGASTPALAIASSRHETQYTRLYRS